MQETCFASHRYMACIYVNPHTRSVEMHSGKFSEMAMIESVSAEYSNVGSTNALCICVVTVGQQHINVLLKTLILLYNVSLVLLPDPQTGFYVKIR